MRRKKTIKIAVRSKRVYRTVMMKRKVIQCERPYVLFGEAVRVLRHRRDMRQQDLADALSVSRGSIANIEVGRQRILLSDVFDFAKVLKISPSVLFDAVSK